VVVSDAGSVWNTGGLTIGYGGAGNSLVISNGGQVIGSGTLSSSNNTVLVSDPGSAWNNADELFIGGSAYNSLVISNGGQVAGNSLCDIGEGIDCRNNSVVVSGSGSVLSNRNQFIVGNYGAGSRLVISSGGKVISGGSCVGLTANSNSVLVTDPGSIWSNGFLYVGSGSGHDNSLVVSNGGQVISRSGYVFYGDTALVTGSGSVWNSGFLSMPGFGSLTISNAGLMLDNEAFVGDGDTSSSNNTVCVTDGGAWQSGVLYVGNQGSSNSVVIGGGSVFATNLVVGFASILCNNLLELDSGSVTVTNGGTGVMEVRHGKLILTGGTLQADTLVITNACASFVHTGGTLIVGTVVLDPNTFRIVSVARQSNDMLVTWMMGPGATNTLQATVGDGSGGYSTNGFSDIFVVTNNTAVGTVTNYLDIGAATNTPVRYYRARLVP
jgi:T5SS/PEP-CTERM-associated repeat protein